VCTEKMLGFLIAAIAGQLILYGLASAGVIAPVVHGAGYCRAMAQ
jgi:hypothetical protein